MKTIKNWFDIDAKTFMMLRGETEANKIIKILYGTQLNKIPLKDLPNISFLETEIPVIDFRTIKLNGVEFGLVDLDKISAGEFIDLQFYLSDYETNIFKIMALCYRPIAKKSKTRGLINSIWATSLEYFKDNSAYKQLQKKAVMEMTKPDYKLVEYSEELLENENLFKGVSAPFLNSFLLFFSLYIQTRLKNTLKSLEQKK